MWPNLSNINRKLFLPGTIFCYAYLSWMVQPLPVNRDTSGLQFHLYLATWISTVFGYCWALPVNSITVIQKNLRVELRDGTVMGNPSGFWRTILCGSADRAVLWLEGLLLYKPVGLSSYPLRSSCLNASCICPRDLGCEVFVSHPWVLPAPLSLWWQLKTLWNVFLCSAFAHEQLLSILQTWRTQVGEGNGPGIHELRLKRAHRRFC